MNFGHTNPDGTVINERYYRGIFHTTNYGITKQMHDSYGNLLMNLGETMILQHYGHFNLYVRWSMYVENIFGIDTRRGAVYKGDGHFYMTDKRLVGFRYYDPYGEASYWEQKYGRPIEVTEMPHKGFRIVGYIRDFIDIPLNEIVALDTKYSNLYILSNLIPYRCPISNELAEMIRIILDKKVVTRETKSAFPDKYERFYFVDPRSVAEAWKHENKHDKRWQMLQKAMSYEDEGKYEKAIDCYKKIIELFPDDTHSQKMIRALSNPRTLQGMSNASNATASLSLELNGGNQ